jgi:hypothetical protein
MRIWKLALSTVALLLFAFTPAAVPTGVPLSVGTGGCAEYMCGTNRNQVLV